MEPTTLRRLQLVELEILDEFVRLCDKNNLTYFFDGGTLLGAVRHKGFIPWDDDIDVGMSRADYDKLAEICKHEQPEGYFFQEGRTYKKYWHVYGKFRKNNTQKLEINPPPFYPDEHRGINIDVFPFDVVSQSNSIRKIQSFFVTKIRFLLFEKRGYTSSGSFFHTIIKRFFALLLPFSFLHNLVRCVMKFKIGTCKNISCWGGVYGYQKETYPIETIFPLSKLEFEGKQYCVPGNWDAYLTQCYGDYMTPPPESEQIIHSPGIIFDIKTDDRGQF
jgi:lipopolysaccharide cholinephosphotransferase